MHPTRTTGRDGHRGIAPLRWLGALAPLVALLAVAPPAAAGAALDRIKESKTLKLGYGSEGVFIGKDASGKPSGFAIDLCNKIGEAAKAEMPSLTVELVPISHEEGIAAVVQGKVDVLCDVAQPTVASRKQVSFSIPVFASGTGAVVRRDSSERLKDVLSGRPPQSTALWRANADQLLRNATLSAVAGSRSESVLKERLRDFQIVPKYVPVSDLSTGVARVLDGRTNAFFGDRALLLEAARRSPASHELLVLDRYFSNETYAFALPRGDEDLRLLVDGALSRVFRSNELRALYEKSFGKLGDTGLNMYRLGTLPD